MKYSKLRSGFALIATITIMLLIVLVAMAMLSLSTSTIRSQQLGSAQVEAQANARMALMLAIGELQRQMGPDQRISANGAILGDSSKHAHWLGSWDSWRAGGSDTAGGDAPSHHSTIGSVPASQMHPTYEPYRQDHFRSWLLSLKPAEARSASLPLSLTLSESGLPGAGSDAVRLVGEGSLASSPSPQDFVHARLLSTETGRYGWWIGDESQKARLMDDTYQISDVASNMAERLFRHQAPGSTGTTTVKGLEAISDAQQERLSALQSRLTLELVDGVTAAVSDNFHHATPFSYSLLTDVREGGMKRDLSTLLERNISISETGDEFMLYRFDTEGEERVPIQDLAAYYQLYDSNRPGWSDGVEYSSNLVPNGLQVSSPDFGNRTNMEKFLRAYTTLYRRPVPIKIQFLLSMNSEVISPAPTPTTSNPDPDTHRLVLGITPSVTLWNPSSLPIVMNYGDPYHDAEMLRLNNLPFFIKWNKNDGEYVSLAVNMSWVNQGGHSAGYSSGKANICSLYFSGNHQIKLEPGEVKVFSLPYRAGVFSFGKWDRFTPHHEMVAGWDPTTYLLMRNSAPGNDGVNTIGNKLTFKPSDQISFSVHPETASGAESLAGRNELPGSGLQFFMIQTSHQNRSSTGGLWHFRHFQFTSRFGSHGNTVPFNAALIAKGFPGGTGPITAPARTGANIINATQNNESWPFLQFALMAGTETAEMANGGSFGGRKFASRPFHHSTSISPPFIDREDNNSLYNYGWNWWVQSVNSVLEANVQVSPDNHGYYGGGYTPESGTTHVVQQEVPVVPPMSIASLSSAHLGGFSLASESPVGFGDGIDGSTGYYGLVRAYDDQYKSFQKVTATGHGGLFPHTLQAIGNSYAHPTIPADRATTTISRFFNQNAGPKSKTFADHSYLANKALWDEFFFSSISPQPAAVKVFGQTSDRAAKTLVEKFFFDDEPLPNRRMEPYKKNLSQAKLNSLFSAAQQQQFTGGLADKIAAHLMLEGPFNVNSTSVEAWKVFLSSLKGKKIAYLDREKALTSGLSLDEDTPAGTPVGPVSLPNGKSYTGSDSDPSEPEQWASWRELTDTEIEEFAVAMVKQVKLRGPFLSLSEFVNRRLDSGNEDLSVKGAMQAALDDDDVSINSGFRSAGRKFSSAEINSMSPAFKKALEGPIAYGSAAYVDQADILRNFAGQLTPRGDTFVIRTYGDSLDGSGIVRARAWCEAVVQRLPEYLDLADEVHVKHVNLTSDTNKAFGRQFRIISFRWLNDSEV